MDEDTIQDLKQFITATVSQNTADIRSDISRLEDKVDDIAEGVAEALDTSNSETQKQIDAHGQRIGRLEQKIA